MLSLKELVTTATDVSEKIRLDISCESADDSHEKSAFFAQKNKNILAGLWNYQIHSLVCGQVNKSTCPTKTDLPKIDIFLFLKENIHVWYGYTQHMFPSKKYENQDASNE